MKNLFLSVAIVALVAPAAFAAGGSQASQPKSGASHAQATPAKSSTKSSTKPAMKTHVVNAEFVSYDATSKTITLKDDKGQTSTAPVEGKAISEAAHLKANEKVRVTCRDNANGEHQAVTDIRAASKSKA
jgi:hypothetical protein